MPLDDLLNNSELEKHPLLPSGAWEGFYCYNHSPQQHRMSIDLLFAEMKVSGSGIDDVAPFTWTGKYNVETYKLEMTKHYQSHKVWYRGDIDENGIWGMWEIAHDYSRFTHQQTQFVKTTLKNVITGGFHIWPKKNTVTENENVMSEAESSEKLKEIFIEIFN